MRENYNGEGNLSFPKGDPLAAKITPPIDLHGETLIAYISESTSDSKTKNGIEFSSRRAFE